MKSGWRHGAAFTSKVSLSLGVVLALIGAWALLNTEAQTLKIRPVKDFKVPEYYPNVTPGATNRLKSLLTGAEARPRPDGLVFVKEPRIQSFSEAGQTQVVVRAAECVYDYKTKTASSTNTVQFQTADGKFYLEGLGFGWDQTNSNLVISNKVRTLISRPVAESISAKSPQSTGAEEKIEISSDQLEYVSESNLATWRENVRVKEPRLNMTCELLTATFRGDEEKSGSHAGKLERLVAETNVAALITESNNVIIAKGDKIVYSAENETLALSGKNPMVESETYHLQMKSPDITMNLTNKTLKAKAPIRTKVPGAFGKLSEAGLSANPSGPKPVEADESVEVSSDDFEFASETKVAVWRGNVRAKDPKLNLTCELLTAKLASGDQGKPASQGGKLESIVAETNVVMTITETNGVTTARADKAVYSAQNETLVLSAKEVMLESASARLQMWSPSITMGLTNKMLKATAPVRTKLPSGAFGKMGDVGLNPRPGDARPAGVEETIEVLADSFEFTAQPKLAIWRENVRAKDPKLDLRCELLTANLASEGGKLQSVVAEVNVVVTITETNGVTTARGDKAFYSAEGETLVLSGKDPTVKSDSPKFELWSAEITYDLKNRTIHPKPPLRGSILPSAFGKLKENKSSHSPTERKPAEVKK